MTCFEPNHQWRVRDVMKLAPEEKAEYEADVTESNRRYDQAFVAVLSHTSEAEQTAFWQPFAENDDELRESLGTLQAMTKDGPLAADNQREKRVSQNMAFPASMGGSTDANAFAGAANPMFAGVANPMHELQAAPNPLIRDELSEHRTRLGMGVGDGDLKAWRSNSTGKQVEVVEHRHHPGLGGMMTAASHAVHSVEHAVEHAAHEVGTAVHSVEHAVEHTAHEVGAAASHGLHDLQQRVLHRDREKENSKVL